MKIYDKIKNAPIMTSIKNAFIIVGKLFLLVFVVYLVLYVYDEFYTREVNRYLPDYYSFEISEQVLRKRFEEFSSSGTLIKVKIQNKKTKEKMVIITGNISWYFICLDELKIVKNDKEYVDYMLKNYKKTFEVSDKTYKRFEYSRADKSYAEIRNLGWPEIKRRYLTSEASFYVIKNNRFERDNNFIAILLDQDVVIQVNCLYYKLHINDYTPYYEYDEEECCGMTMQETLKMRFEETIKSGTYIKVKMKNKQTKEEMSVVTKNDLWYLTCLDDLKIVKDDDEYTDYMVKNYNKTFEVDNKIYNKYKPGKINGDYDEIGKKGWGYVRSCYFDKREAECSFRSPALEKNNNFLGMLLDFNIIVREKIDSETVYVEDFSCQ